LVIDYQNYIVFQQNTIALKPLFWAFEIYFHGIKLAYTINVSRQEKGNEKQKGG
jgi:hypothetical protein